MTPGRGHHAGLSDAELVTLAVLQALLGFVSEARWLRFARTSLLGLFPCLPQQPGYNKRLRNLAGVGDDGLADPDAPPGPCPDPAPNPAAAEPDGRRVLSRIGVADHEARPRSYGSGAVVKDVGLDGVLSA